MKQGVEVYDDLKNADCVNTRNICILRLRVGIE